MKVSKAILFKKKKNKNSAHRIIKKKSSSPSSQLLDVSAQIIKLVIFLL